MSKTDDSFLSIWGLLPDRPETTQVKSLRNKKLIYFVSFEEVNFYEVYW